MRLRMGVYECACVCVCVSFKMLIIRQQWLLFYFMARIYYFFVFYPFSIDLYDYMSVCVCECIFFLPSVMCQPSSPTFDYDDVDDGAFAKTVGVLCPCVSVWPINVFPLVSFRCCASPSLCSFSFFPRFISFFWHFPKQNN